ncbi:hypothetical protein BJF89_10265 [Corynebacterium sp. CNJ-954]|uniref:hypothetical protein n=1 Tax=Corynebacterium sp. CNJ-954 TaxID=1904962 RepID=UPI000959EA7A|nr:hypothetical protein [Corynebacterium sp. CNJ-954]OLT50289.1 hypothetical protein BJF89_10265 [Corynebacterium sp. CNJ-954]
MNDRLDHRAFSPTDRFEHICEVCGIDATVWWAIAMDKLPLDDLTPDQLKTIARIRNEVPD